MFLTKIRQDIKDLKLEPRVSDIEEKLDTLMAYLKLTIDYTESAESELIIRKRTKKDETAANYVGMSDWF